MIKIEDDGKNISVKGPYSADTLKSLASHDEIENLSLTNLKNLTVKIAEGLCHLKSVKELLEVFSFYRDKIILNQLNADYNTQ